MDTMILLLAKIIIIFFIYNAFILSKVKTGANIPLSVNSVSKKFPILFNHTL